MKRTEVKRETPPGEERQRQGARPGLSASVRRAPLGILVLAAIFATFGAGIMAGGLFLVITDSEARWWAAVSTVLLGPLVLYLALELVRLAHWTWLTLLIVGALLLASSVVRLALTPGLALAPAAEIVVIITALFYITRPTIRRSFGWSGSEPSPGQ